MTRRRGDEGSGTVLLLALVGVIATAAVLLGLLASAQAARGRAQAAADLAALAGAAELLVGGTGEPCPVVAQAVRRNGGHLLACVDEGGGVVRVEVAVSSLAGTANAQARAGPVSARG